MRFEGTLVRWDDVRGIGYLESTQGGEPLFVHISALPVLGGRPRQGDRYSFEVAPNPRGGKQAVRGQRIGPARHPTLQPVDPERSPLGATGAQRAGLGPGPRASHATRDRAEPGGGRDRRQARPPLPPAPSRGHRHRGSPLRRLALRLGLGLVAGLALATVGTQVWRSHHADPFDSLPPTSAGLPMSPPGAAPVPPHAPVHTFTSPLASTPPPPPKTAHSADFSTPQVAYRCDGRQHCSQMRSCNEARYFLAHCPTVKMDGDHDGVPCEDTLCSGPLAR